MALYNLAGFKTTTLGVADVVFSAPITALNTFPLAGVPNGATVTYMLENFDGTGAVDAREVGRGTWDSGTLTLARTTVVDSTNGGAKIVLGGTAEARITAIAQDFTAAAVGAPALVTPSVAGNFVSFSNITGGQADSGVSAASFQPVDATLTSIGLLGTAADRMIYTTGVDTWAETPLTAFARDILDDANGPAVLTTIGAQAALGYTPVDIASADWIDLTDGGATTLHTHAASGVAGSGVVGQLAEWVTNTTTLQAAKIIGPTGAILTLINANAKSITFPGSTNDTVAMLATANVYTVPGQMIDSNSDAIDFVIQAHSTKTTSHFVIENSAGTDLFAINRLGGITQDISNDYNSTSVGNLNSITYTLSTSSASWPNNTTALNLSLVINTALNRIAYGTIYSASYSASSGNHDAVLGGGRFSAFSDTSGGGYVTTLIGGDFISKSQTSRSGYALNYYAGKFTVTCDANAAKTATLAAALYVPSITGNGNVTVPLVYGLKIDDQTFGTTRYAIHTSIGLVSLLGSYTVASAAGAVWDGIALRAATATISGSTNITTATGFNYHSIARPTLSAASALTVSIAATLYIANAPLGGGAGPVTITTPLAFWVDDGLSRFDGGVQVASVTNDTGLAHGTYTPTRSAEANLDANVTMTEAQYMRVGNTVTVSGRFTADPTLTATTTSFEITLPVASNIGAVEDLAGVAFCGNIVSQGAEVTGSVANNTAVITWKAADITSQSWSYTFTYQVI